MANKSKKVNLDRRRFLVTATSVTGAIGATSLGVPFVSSMLPSEKAKAAGASVQVDVSKVEARKSVNNRMERPACLDFKSIR